MKKIVLLISFGIVLIFIFLIYHYFISFSLSGLSKFQKNSLESKQLNSLIYRYELENRRFTIGGTKFNINDVWIAKDVYTTNKKNEFTINESSATFYISLTNSNIYYKNYFEECELKIQADESVITFDGVFFAGKKYHLIESLNEMKKKFIKNNKKMELILVKDSTILFRSGLTRL